MTKLTLNFDLIPSKPSVTRLPTSRLLKKKKRAWLNQKVSAIFTARFETYTISQRTAKNPSRILGHLQANHKSKQFNTK